MSLERQLRSVLSKSKKIQRTVISPISPKSKKYKTFNTTTRNAIIFSLRRALVARELAQPEQNLHSSDFLRILDTIALPELNKILHRVLEEHILQFRADVHSLRRWRRKIREWIVASEKPEARGHLLIPHDKLSLFKEHLIPELLKMPTRNLVTAKKKVMKVFKMIKHAVPKKSCSKHWWYRFLEKNVEIKEIWEGLPKRAKKDEGPEAEEIDSDPESEPDQDFSVKMEEEEDVPFKQEEKGYKMECKKEYKKEYNEFRECKIELEIKQENSNPFKLEGFGVKKEEEPFWSGVKKESSPLSSPAFSIPALNFDEKIKTEGDDRIKIESNDRIKVEAQEKIKVEAQDKMKIEEMIPPLREPKIEPKVEQSFITNGGQIGSLQALYRDYFARKERMMQYFANPLNWGPKREEPN